MKVIFFTSFLLNVSFCIAFCQCPGSALTVQSAACEDPKNLKVLSISCSELKVNWLGNKDQSYILNASYIDPETNTLAKIKNARTVADKSGSFTAAFKVKEGAVISWTVQAVCSLEDALIYSAAVKAADVYIPICQKIKEKQSINGVNIYPNPASGYLNVELTGKVEGSIEFRVLDVAGKKVFNKTVGAGQKTNNLYTLDLRSLPPGTYMIETANRNNVRQAKFVLIRN